MVLRGAQFQRFGPAGCIVLTRRALSSYRIVLAQGRCQSVCLPQGRRLMYRRLRRLHGGNQYWHFLEDSRCLTREGDCMSWPYWGIVIGLTVMVIMIITCIRLLSLDETKEPQGVRPHSGGSGDSASEPSAVSRRAA